MNNKEYPMVLLCVLDGWGRNDDVFGNAIKAAKTPTFDYLNEKYPPIYLSASGENVGLPEGQMGNSEVGHLNIGAGRVVMQDLPRINVAIRDGSFFDNTVIAEGMKKALAGKAGYHLLGLVSDGGVHSHIDHIGAFLKMAKNIGLGDVYIHALMDGRDTPPNSGAGYMRYLLKMTKDIGVGKVASISGRYYTMDRDRRWDRVEKGYNAMVHGIGLHSGTDPVAIIEKSYDDGITDEFIKPSVILGANALPVGIMRDGDVLQVFNFRADRVRQVVHAMGDEGFNAFDRGNPPQVDIYCLTEYDENFTYPVAFTDAPPENGLGQVLSTVGIKQFRSAETEKYAHVTFFFNGGREEPFPGETRRLVPSPKVATYDLQPEMSACEVTDGVVKEIEKGESRVLVVNLANGDMVGHTGVMEAAIKAVEAVDACVGRMLDAVRKTGGTMIVTADHGNIEAMLNENNEPITSHSTNMVPLYLYAPEKMELNPDGGALRDIAPTILKIMGIPKPAEMTGKSLIKDS